MKGAHGDPSRDGFARSQAGGRGGGVEMNTLRTVSGQRQMSQNGKSVLKQITKFQDTGTVPKQSECLETLNPVLKAELSVNLETSLFQNSTRFQTRRVSKHKSHCFRTLTSVHSERHQVSWDRCVSRHPCGFKTLGLVGVFQDTRGVLKPFGPKTGLCLETIEPVLKHWCLKTPKRVQNTYT